MSSDSRTRILEAAIQVFAQKGPHGARMEDIGAEAKINKAMVYYYYSNKENLFQQAINLIINKTYSEIIEGMRETTERTDDPVQVLVRFVRVHFSAFSRRKEWTQLLLEALSNKPEYLRSAFRNAFESENFKETEVIEQAYRKGVDQGIFRDIDFRQVFISIIGMNVVFFLARPIAEVLLDLEIKDKKSFLLDREDSIVDMLLRGVLKRDDPAEETGEGYAALSPVLKKFGRNAG